MGALGVNIFARALAYLPILCACLLVIVSGCENDSEQTVMVFAASSMTSALEEIQAACERTRPDIDVQMVFAGSQTRAKIELRALVREILASFAGPCLYITHDPIDALTLGDEIAVIEAGRITQIGTPDELQRRPRSSYAASFLGINLIEGVLRDTPDGWCVSLAGSKTVWITDPDLAAGTPICLANAPEGSARNVFEASVEAVHVQHDRVRVRFAAPAVVAEISIGSMNRLGIAAGVRVWISFKATDVRVYPQRGGEVPVNGASNG
jgi:ABC-type molybdate transport system ATPase subunit